MRSKECNTVLTAALKCSDLMIYFRGQKARKDPRRKTCCFARPESTSRPENGDPVSESCIEKASGRVQNVLPKCLNLPCSLYVLEDGAPLTPSVGWLWGSKTCVWRPAIHLRAC